MRPANINELMLEVSASYPPYSELAQRALIDTFGPYEKWDRQQRLRARRFIRVIASIPQEALSLATLKVALAKEQDAASLHKLAYVFLTLLRKSTIGYHAQDAVWFGPAMDALEYSGRSYRTLMQPEVRTFANLAFNKKGAHYDFYIIHSNNEIVVKLINAFANTWPIRQDRLDDVTAILEKALKDRPSKHLTIDHVFAMVDAMREHGSRVGVQDVIALVRYALSTPFNGITDMQLINALQSRKATTFFCDEYISKAKTALFCPRDRNAKPRYVTIDIPEEARKTVAHLLSSGDVANVEFHSAKAIFSTQSKQEWRWNEEQLRSCYESCMTRYSHMQVERCHAIAFFRQLFILADREGGGAFLADANTLTYSLLTCHLFVSFCSKGYRFIRYSPFDDNWAIEDERIVFITPNNKPISNSKLAKEFISINFDRIHDPFFRRMAWGLVTSSENYLCDSCFSIAMNRLLPELIRIKNIIGYETPEHNVFSTTDALFLSSALDQMGVSTIKYNESMRAMRALLRLASDAGYMKVDALAIRLLGGRVIDQASKDRHQRIPDEHFRLLHDHLFEKAKKGEMVDIQMYALLILVRVTSIRICRLMLIDRTQIQRDRFSGRLQLVSPDKPSEGDNVIYTFGKTTESIILGIARMSQVMEKECKDANLRGRLFLPPRSARISHWTTKLFSERIKENCLELKLPPYTAWDIRPSYMTDTWIKAASMETDPDQFELQLLFFSGHTRIRTVRDYYLDVNTALRKISESVEREQRGSGIGRLKADDRLSILLVTKQQYEKLIEGSPDEQAKFLREKLQSIIEEIDEISNG